MSIQSGGQSGLVIPGAEQAQGHFTLDSDMTSGTHDILHGLSGVPDVAILIRDDINSGTGNLLIRIFASDGTNSNSGTMSFSSGSLSSASTNQNSKLNADNTTISIPASSTYSIPAGNYSWIAWRFQSGIGGA